MSVLSIDYSVKNLLKRYTSISSNSASIGITANGEMIKSAIGIEHPKTFELLNKYFIWDLERIIDSTVKDGVSCSDDMKAIRNMYSFIIINNIKLPKSIIHRLPNRFQESAKISEGHLLDELLEAIKMLITKADREIVGSGSVKKGNRIEGWVDSLNILVIELGMANLGNEKNKKAKVLLKKYNKQIAILLEKTKNIQRADKMKEIKKKVESIQSDYLVELSKYTSEERYKIILSITYEIYKSSSSVHDSILWINDKNSANGTALDMIEILSKIGEAFTVKENGNVQREEIRPAKRIVETIRLWSKERIDIETISSANEVLIENRQALIGDKLLNIGDACRLNNGIYSLLSLAPSYNQSKNSYLYNSFSATLI